MPTSQRRRTSRRSNLRRIGTTLAAALEPRYRTTIAAVSNQQTMQQQTMTNERGHVPKTVETVNPTAPLRRENGIKALLARPPSARPLPARPLPARPLPARPLPARPLPSWSDPMWPHCRSITAPAVVGTRMTIHGRRRPWASGIATTSRVHLWTRWRCGRGGC